MARDGCGHGQSSNGRVSSRRKGWKGSGLSGGCDGHLSLDNRARCGLWNRADHDHVSLGSTQTHLDVADVEDHRATEGCLANLGDVAALSEPEHVEPVTNVVNTLGCNGLDSRALASGQAAERHDGLLICGAAVYLLPHLVSFVIP